MSDNTTQVVRPDTASHWYLVDPKKGIKSFHTVPYAGKRGKNGETRKTTLRDARKVNAFPSVTNILGVLHKDFLEAYKVNQAILAALTLPKIDGESEDEFAKRVVTDSKEHAASAARLGSRLHEVGADYLKGITSKDSIKEGEIVEGRRLEDVAKPLRDLIEDILPAGMYTPEELSEFYVSHPIGFAGTCDGFVWLDTSKQFIQEKLTYAGYASDAGWSGELGGWGRPVCAIADIKSRGANTKKPLVYETDLLQLGAYLHAVSTTPGLGFVDPNNTPVANILVNTHPKAGTDDRWEAELVIHKKEDLKKAWEAFKHAQALWCWVKNYNPNEEK